jgi:hypothetical protein
MGMAAWLSKMYVYKHLIFPNDNTKKTICYRLGNYFFVKVTTMKIVSVPQGNNWVARTHAALAEEGDFRVESRVA